MAGNSTNTTPNCRPMRCAPGLLHESSGSYSALSPRFFFSHHHAMFDFGNSRSWHKHHPPLPPSSDSAVGPYAASAYGVSLDAKENPQEVSLVRRWLAVLSIPRASICVTCASMVRCDESPLYEGAVLICCDIYVCRRRVQNFLRRDGSK